MFSELGLCDGKETLAQFCKYSLYNVLNNCEVEGKKNAVKFICEPLEAENFPIFLFKIAQTELNFHLFKPFSYSNLFLTQYLAISFEFLLNNTFKNNRAPKQAQNEYILNASR